MSDETETDKAFFDVMMFGRGYTKVTTDGVKHMPILTVERFEPPPRTLAEIKARDADGLPLPSPGDFGIEAHRDRGWLLAHLEEVRVQIMSMRAYMQFGAFQGLDGKRFEKFRHDFDEILEALSK